MEDEIKKVSEYRNGEICTDVIKLQNTYNQFIKSHDDIHSTTSDGIKNITSLINIIADLLIDIDICKYQMKQAAEKAYGLDIDIDQTLDATYKRHIRNEYNSACLLQACATKQMYERDCFAYNKRKKSCNALIDFYSDWHDCTRCSFYKPRGAKK